MRKCFQNTEIILHNSFKIEKIGVFFFEKELLFVVLV